jgi:clan AA aspartic protease (TIGR02281 family)
MALLTESRRFTAIFLGWLFTTTAAFAEDFTDGVMAFRSKDYKRASHIFENLKSAGGDLSQVFYYSAVTHEQLGEYDKAAGEYLTVVKNFPQSQAGRLSVVALQRPTFNALVQNAATPQRNPSLDTLPRETWVPYKLKRKTSIVVEAYVDGKPCDMTFDTGAAACCITFDQLKALGIPPPQGKPDTLAGGAGSSERMGAWTLHLDLRLGKIERRQFPMLLLDTHLPTPLLGENFYHDYAYTIDTASNSLIFKQHGAQTAATSYSSSAGLTVGSNGKYVYNVPFTLEGKSLVVNANIEGKMVPMIFDTGADFSTFTTTQAAQLGLNFIPTGRVVIMAGVGGKSTAKIFHLKSVRLGPIDSDMMCVVTEVGAMPHPLLGQNFFHDYQYTIDHSSHVIRFEQK